MALLTYRMRKKLPLREFAIESKAPESGSYPLDTKARARNALARVAQHGTPAERAEVRREVHARYPGIGKYQRNKGGK